MLRGRLHHAGCGVAAHCGAATRHSAGSLLDYRIAVVLIVVYGMIIWLDSSSLIAGAAGAADPARRGATHAVHSILGYADGFVGPVAIG